MISILYESGCRIGEILNMRIRNVEFDANGAVLIVNGKTGQRRVRLIHSVPRLVTWLEHHPERDPKAFLWVCVGSKNNRQPAHASMHRIMLKKASGGLRCARVIDSPYLPESEAYFQITEKGVEDATPKSRRED